MTTTKIDTAKALGVAAGATGVAIADINEWLTFISVLLSISYIIWKWHKDSKK